jgi:putative hemolysin
MRVPPVLIGVALCLAAFDTAAQTALANPASQNCAAKGGKPTIEKNPKGGEYGVCVFPDNRQCEEWAMLRGQCPAGGVKVAGHATPAARYCAITGGTYKVSAASDTPGEKGTCTLPGANTCEALAYFDGSCARQVAAAARPVTAKFACAGGKSIDATFSNYGSSIVHLVLSDGRKLSLPQAMSGSSARYANADESIVFWKKGKTTYDGCATGRRATR